MTPPPKAAAKASGGISAPPKGTTQKRASSGPLTPPPGQGRGTWQQTQNTQRANTEVKGMYDKAEEEFKKARDRNEAAYQKAVAAGQDAKAARAITDGLNATAAAELETAKAAAAKYYDEQVRTVGGTPGSAKSNQPPAGATMVYKDKNGAVKGYAVNGQYVPAGQ